MIRLFLNQQILSVLSFDISKYLTVWRIYSERPFSGTQYLRWIASEENPKWIVVHLLGRSTVRWITSEENVWLGSELCFIFEDAVFSLNCNRRELLSSKWIVVHFRGRTAVRWIASEGNIWKRSESSSIFGDSLLKGWLTFEENDWTRCELSSIFGDAFNYIRRERVNQELMIVYFRGWTWTKLSALTFCLFFYRFRRRNIRQREYKRGFRCVASAKDDSSKTFLQSEKRRARTIKIWGKFLQAGVSHSRLSYNLDLFFSKYR